MATARIPVRHLIYAGILCAGAALTGLAFVATAPARAETSCDGDSSKSLAAARAALRGNTPDHDRVALACLIEAVGALNARLQGLSDGSIAFEGQVYAPKGVVVSKASTGEAH